MNLSLRARLLLRHAAFFLVGMLIFAALIWFGVRSTLRSDSARWVDSQAAGLERFLQSELRGHGEAAILEEAREFSSGLPIGSGISILSENGRLLFQRPENGPPPGVPITAATKATMVDGHRYNLQLWRSRAETELVLARLLWLMVGLVPVVLLAAFAGGWWVSRNALQPIDELIQAARITSLQSLAARLPVPSQQDELQRLCQAWNEMLARMEDSAGRLQQFTADASHELRTPVAVIRTSAELALRQERTPEHYRETLRQIAAQSSEMTQLIENLLALARADAGGALPLRPLEASALIEEVAGQFNARALLKPVRLIIQPRLSPIIIAGDPASLRRLFAILLDNAIKFTEPGGTIHLAAEVSGHRATFLVQDDGCGIAEEHRARIFDRFFQADASRSSGGSGLGLSLAQWIARLHGGAIEVESTPGQGSRFLVQLPTQKDE